MASTTHFWPTFSPFTPSPTTSNIYHTWLCAVIWTVPACSLTKLQRWGDVQSPQLLALSVSSHQISWRIEQIFSERTLHIGCSCETLLQVPLAACSLFWTTLRDDNDDRAWSHSRPSMDREMWNKTVHDATAHPSCADVQSSLWSSRAAFMNTG